jgi:tetratricopeptide (TPR) repeat protein
LDARELFVSGVDNFLRGEYELAKNLFEMSLKLSPDKISTLINYSATLIELGLLEDAINVCDHILSLDNFNIQGMINKSNIFKLKKNYNESISILNKIIEFGDMKSASREIIIGNDRYQREIEEIKSEIYCLNANVYHYKVI